MADKYKNRYRIKSIRLQNWDYGWGGAYFITICTKGRENYFGQIKNGKMQLSSIGVIADILWYEIKNHAKNVELGEYVVMPNHVHGILILNGNDNAGDTGNIGNAGDSGNTGNIGVIGDIGVIGVETGHALSLPPSPPSPPSPPTPPTPPTPPAPPPPALTQTPPLTPTSTSPPPPPSPPTSPPPPTSTSPPPPPTSPSTSTPASTQRPQNGKTIGQNRFQNIGKNTISSIVGGYKSAVTKHAHRLNFTFEWQCNYWEHIIRNENEYRRISQYIIDNPAKWENDKLNGGKGNIVMEPPTGYNSENWML